MREKHSTKAVALTRRDAIKSALIGGAALATPGLMVRAANAKAPMLGARKPDFYRFKLGDFEITTLRDGSRAGEGPHPTFGADQPAEAVHELLRENRLPETRFVNGFTPTVVNTGNEVVLFDTGLGAGARANGMGRLAEVIERAGYGRDQIDIVVITHMHPDHIGGLMEEGAPAFPNARYVTGEREFDFWSAPERMGTPAERVAKLVEANVKPLADKTSFVKDGGSVVSGITALEAFGHTPGHLVFNIESAGRRLMITADTANHFVVSLQRPEWEVVFDTDKAAAAQTRSRVFDMVASDRIPFIGYHMPWPSVGFVEKMDVGYRYIPNSYQMDI